MELDLSKVVSVADSIPEPIVLPPLSKAKGGVYETMYKWVSALREHGKDSVECRAAKANYDAVFCAAIKMSPETEAIAKEFGIFLGRQSEESNHGDTNRS